MRFKAALLTVVCVCAASAPAAAVDTWTTPHPGVRRLLRTTATPNRIHALVVDLCATGVSVRATARGENRRTPSSFGSLVGAEAVINADFFSFTTYLPSGFAVGDTAPWHADSRASGYVAFGTERVELSPPAEIGGPAWIREAVGGRPHLVSGGNVIGPFPSPTHCSARNPRTAVGFTADRRKLIMVVVDGRSAASAGMTCAQLATLMVSLGADEALNLDGGGSSAMWIRGTGVVNRPSDGSQRVVSNHLAIFATGAGAPGSCDYSVDEVETLAETFDSARTTDIDGDGRADLCVRSATDFRCYPSAAAGGVAIVTGPALSDVANWDEPQYWSTIRMGDIDGDGRADLCARGGAGVSCYLSTGTGFGGAIVGPALSDAAGWSPLSHATSLRLADVTGDGADDLCVRSGAGVECHPSNGGGFDAPILGPALSDAMGWADPANYGTIRYGDIDGDGLVDLCARADAGMQCWRSDGAAFGPAITGPAWSDAAGFDRVSKWATIRLVDVDGDGRDDLCARVAAGFVCHLSTGDGFGAAAMGPTWSDSSGWADNDNYATIRMADIDGDGSTDVCARANAGIRCSLWDGAAHGMAIVGPDLSDADGWDAPSFFRTISLADVTGDGLADLCARDAAGVRCWPSGGMAFGAPIDGPALSDGDGWGNERYYGTLRLSGPRCTVRLEVCNGADDDCDGAVDEGCEVDAGTSVVDGGAPTDFDAAIELDAALDAALDAGAVPMLVEGGCGCRAGGVPEERANAGLALALFGVGVIAVRACRRRRGVRAQPRASAAIIPASGSSTLGGTTRVPPSDTAMPPASSSSTSAS